MKTRFVGIITIFAVGGDFLKIGYFIVKKDFFSPTGSICRRDISENLSRQARE